jgi:hypothetical protein
VVRDATSPQTRWYIDGLNGSECDVETDDDSAYTSRASGKGGRSWHSYSVARGLAYAPYADLVWCGTATPDLDEARGYTATRHQHEVGTGYFDEVAQVIAGAAASTTALAGSAEAAQFTAVR